MKDLMSNKNTVLEIRINNLVLHAPTLRTHFGIHNYYVLNNSTYYDLFWSTIVTYLHTKGVVDRVEKGKALNLKSGYYGENSIWSVGIQL